jgi:hypothetical protein
MRYPIRRTIVRLALPLTLAACASSSSGRSPQSSPDKITRNEIISSNAMNALDVVNRLRPDWLRGRSPASIGGGGISTQLILVYLDGHRLGDLTALRTLSANGIQSMQWVDAVRAETVLSDVGSDPIAGAILIRTQ